MIGLHALYYSNVVNVTLTINHNKKYPFDTCYNEINVQLPVLSYITLKVYCNPEAIVLSSVTTSFAQLGVLYSTVISDN